MFTNTTVNGFKLILQVNHTQTREKTIVQVWNVFKKDLFLGQVIKNKVWLTSGMGAPPVDFWSYIAYEKYGWRVIAKQKVYNIRCEAVMGLAKLRGMVE